MAQLLSPNAPDPGRISQILPSVKCSNCNQPVPIAELGDHVCQPAPPMPSLKGQPLMSPLAALQAEVGKHQATFPASRNEQAQQPVSSHQVSVPSAQHVSISGPSGQQTRPRAPSTASTLSARGREARGTEQGAGQALRIVASDISKALFPSRGSPSEPSRVRSPLAGPEASSASEVPFPTTRSPSVTSRSPTPGRSYSTHPDGLSARPRAPSNASTASARPPALVAGPPRQPVHSSPTPYAPPAALSPGSSGGLSAPSLRPRAATNAGPSPPDNGGYELIYSTSSNRNGPSTAPMPDGAPPYNPHSPPMQPHRPRMPSTASLPPTQPLRVRAPSTASVTPYTQHSRPHTPPSAAGRAPFERRPSNLGAGPSSAQSPPPQSVRSPILEIDTKIGGVAGMAGVGRRGFAAAAQAAIFATHIGHLTGPGENSAVPSMMPGQGMDGRRANAPKFLDITSATHYSAASVHTPPLSPANSGTSTLSPRSPFSQKSPVSAGIPSPLSRSHPATPTSPASTPAVASSPISPGGPTMYRDRVVSPPAEPPKTPLPALPTTPSTPSAASFRLPFFEKFKAKQPEVDDSKPNLEDKSEHEPDPADEKFPPSPRSDSDSEYEGLAYAQSDEESDDEKPLKAKLPPLSTSGSTTVKSGNDSEPGKVRFPSMAGSESQYSASSPLSPRAPVRSLSASTGTSRYSARTIAKSTGALERVMETLLEDTATPSSSAAASPAPLTAPLMPEGHRDSRPPKLPMRSHTSPTLGTGRLEQTRGKKRVKERVCARCEKMIEDGRWIQMDGGSVLCDKCWKNMYLPKCRRCNLTIEKAAVSSSDGQLKGKYHRECFNCHQCHKPFPDKSFYVLDGKPFCAYHYHEANNSLCAAATCGQPIEGPCAVSHSGHRYHPEHMLCEYPRCTERLAEYWEVDGRMLCDRHGHKVMSEEDDEVDALEEVAEGTRDSVARAMKRVTRFIDLASLGGSELR